MLNVKTLLPALTIEEVAQRAPQAFAKAPSNEVSDKYVFMDTSVVIRDMEALGWYPVSAKQRKPRKGVTTRFTPHMIIFQNPDIIITSEDEKLAPSIILLNSHDGTSPLSFRMGIFRLVCENGLVIPQEEYTSFQIRHRGYTFEKLRECMHLAVSKVEDKVQVINKMVTKELTEEEQMDLALKALLIRSDISIDAVDTPKYSQNTLRQVLKPVRLADRGNDLWRTLNRVQEAVTRGTGVKVEIEGEKSRKLTPIKSFERDFDVNQKLFEVALEYVN